MTLGHAARTENTPPGRDSNRTVRQASAVDICDIVEVHQKAFRHFFLTQMGSGFLQRYYELVLRYEAGIMLVGVHQSRVQGFACGFVNPAEFYRLMYRNLFRFLPPGISALFRNPSLLTGVLRGAKRIHHAASRETEQECELSSIAVSPTAARGGLGMKLARAFVSQAWAMNAGSVCLSTDAHGNEAANSLYERAGFQRTRQFLQHHGRWMNEYRITRMN